MTEKDNAKDKGGFGYPLLGEVGELVKAQDEYIDFLHEYIGGLAVYLDIHRMSPTPKQIKKGKILRDKIQKVRANFA